MLFEIKKDNINNKNKSIKSIVAELNNSTLESLFMLWLRTLNHPYGRGFIQAQINALNKLPKEIREYRIKKGIELKYGTLIFKKKTQIFIYSREIERLQDKIF